MTWGQSPLARTVQRFVRPMLVGSWFRSMHRVSWTGVEHLRDLRMPFVIAAAPHRHWLDVFALCQALPSHVVRRLLTITNYDFASWLDGMPCRTLSQRAAVFVARWVVSPALFPVTLLPHRGNTRQGLFELAEMMDRGYVPITFPKGFHFGNVDRSRHDSGVASLALEFGAPVVPVWIQGNDQFNERRPFTRPMIRLAIGPPVHAKSLASLISGVEDSFVQLESVTSRKRQV